MSRCDESSCADSGSSFPQGRVGTTFHVKGTTVGAQPMKDVNEENEENEENQANEWIFTVDCNI